MSDTVNYNNDSTGTVEPTHTNDNAGAGQSIKEQLIEDSFTSTATAENTSQTDNQVQEQEQEQTPHQEQTDPLDIIPETYSFTDDEGQPLNDAEIAEFQAPFKEAKLTNRQAKILHDQFIKARQGWVNTLIEDNKKMRADNLAKIHNDPDIGGSHINDTKHYVGAVMDRYGTQELRDYLNETGLGSHPELVRVFARIGKDLTPDGFVQGRGRVVSENSFERAKRMYPKSPELWK